MSAVDRDEERILFKCSVTFLIKFVDCCAMLFAVSDTDDNDDVVVSCDDEREAVVEEDGSNPTAVGAGETLVFATNPAISEHDFWILLMLLWVGVDDFCCRGVFFCWRLFCFDDELLFAAFLCDGV